MSDKGRARHGDELLLALTNIALEVQRVRTVDEQLAVAGSGLKALGYGMAVVTSADLLTYGVRYVNLGRIAEQAARLLTSSRPELTHHASIRRALVEEVPVFIGDVLEQLDAPDEALSHAVRAAVRGVLRFSNLSRLVVAPLNVQNRSWGVLCVLHAGLEDTDTGPLHLFALQLGSAIENATSSERLVRRDAELALVHALAVTPPSSDVTAATEQALAVLTQSTSSAAATLHRLDLGSGRFVLVGRYGTAGDTVLRQFTRFELPPDGLDTLTPQAMAVADVPQGGEALRRDGFTHLAIVPVRLEARMAGLLTLGRTIDTAYTPADLQLAEVLGVQMAAMLERGWLYDNLKRSYDTLARTQAELVRHERLAALGELAAVMAHEVRNPLGVIFNSLTTLRKVIPPSDDADMLLAMVGEEAERLNRIVGDLLDFARPFELTRKLVAIEPVLVSAVDTALKVGTTAKPRVVTEYGHDLPAVPVDAHLLRQALVNLLVNAMQAMGKDGTVTLRARVEASDAGPFLVVEVQDEGPGLDQAMADRIFQPFVTTKATGTGLGLAVVKRIVDAHLGEVFARAAPGRGAIFTLRLPASLESRERVMTPPHARPSAPRH